MPAFRYCTWLLFSFRGRIARKAYFLSSAGLFGVILLGEEALRLGFHVDAFLIALPVLWSASALSCKRFHDFNMGGWWQLTLVPFMLLPESPEDLGMGVSGIFIDLAARLLALPFAWMLALRKGTDGTNTFGPEGKN